MPYSEITAGAVLAIAMPTATLANSSDNCILAGTGARPVDAWPTHESESST
ncbi:MAG: hypothetical protein ACYC9J_11870 [Sulfuricaulis sp.]